MKKIYKQHFPVMAIIIAILSYFLFFKFSISWKSSGSTFHFLFAILSLLVIIVFSKPLIECRRVGIEDGYIIIYRRFFKNIRLKISESLYQIVIKDEIIQHFRFRNGKAYFQISPSIFKNGDEMIENIKDCMKRNKITVEIITKS
ncbi:MAG: hypothetical protein K8S23_13035 [Candidatus Cloacimonetes bacterium]|nr:hypothetical protein [Candidatus Cloacimonadota bacterium]